MRASYLQCLFTVFASCLSGACVLAWIISRLVGNLHLYPQFKKKEGGSMATRAAVQLQKGNVVLVVTVASQWLHAARQRSGKRHTKNTKTRVHHLASATTSDSEPGTTKRSKPSAPQIQRYLPLYRKFQSRPDHLSALRLSDPIQNGAGIARRDQVDASPNSGDRNAR